MLKDFVYKSLQQQPAHKPRKSGVSSQNFVPPNADFAKAISANTAVMEKFAGVLENMGRADVKSADIQPKAPVGYSTYTELHGANGIFATPGMERDVISAHVRPQGIAAILPMYPSTTATPIYGTITGFTGTTGTRPSTPCADAPKGYMKGCNLSAAFGLTRFDTQEIDLLDTMMRYNRGDMMDLILRGRVLGLTNLPPGGMNEQQILSVVAMAEMVTAAVNTERQLVSEIWQGTGTHPQFTGLDSLIATGQTDFQTSQACTALDSDVKNFNYNDVGGSAYDIVEYLSMLEFYIRNNASKMGLDPATWVIAMRPELWFELSAVWPCRYLTHRCDNSAGTNATVINDNVNVQLRDSMRNGMFIDINGRRYPVVTDDGIFEHNNINNGNLGLGEYASSIYMVPLTITGGFPVTYREYKNYSDGLATTNTNLVYQGSTSANFWTDRGIFSWSFERQKWCVYLALRTEQRVVCRTPQLAGRIDAVKYSPLQHLRSYDPDSPYFRDGGVSYDPGRGTAA